MGLKCSKYIQDKNVLVFFQNISSESILALNVSTPALSSFTSNAQLQAQLLTLQAQLLSRAEHWSDHTSLHSFEIVMKTPIKLIRVL